MKKLSDITQFLIQLNLVAVEQIESWAEDARLIYNGSIRSNADNGVALFRQEYTAQIIIERYDHKQHPAELLFAHIVAWLSTFDPTPFDESRVPEFDIDILDNDLADISISIDFDETVEIVPDAAGDIEFNGQRWRLSDSVVNYALTGDVVT